MIEGFRTLLIWEYFMGIYHPYLVVHPRKWLITPLISEPTLLGPFITRVTTYLLSW
jgi:hypothetical protein